MATIKQIFGTATALTIAGLATLADGSRVASDEIDNSVSLNIAEDVYIRLTGAGTGSVDVYIMRANESGIYASLDVVNNMIFVTSVDMSSVTPAQVVRSEQLPKYYKYLFINNSGAALTAEIVKIQSANLTNA